MDAPVGSVEGANVGMRVAGAHVGGAVGCSRGASVDVGLSVGVKVDADGFGVGELACWAELQRGVDRDDVEPTSSLLK